jgi:diacylglycerol kinase (ATP)
MKRKILMIYNPYAGKGKIKDWLSEIIEIFSTAKCEIIIYATQGNKDATHVLMEYLERENFDRVVCSGGDGTLNEIINGIMLSGKKPVLGYIPAGTTNDFAYSIGIPKNMSQAAKVVIKGEPFLCDVGVFNQSFFTYTAAFGIFTDVSYETMQSTKNILGRLAYILEGIKRLPSWKSYEMTIMSKDIEVSGDFIYGMVTNSNSVGGFKGITGKEILLDDGQFEGIFIKVPQNVLDLQEIINNLLTGNLKSDLILSIPVKQLQIESKELVPWTIDGEFGGEYRKVDISNKQQAITIMHKKPER